MTVFTKPAPIKLDDEKAERVRLQHAKVLAEVTEQRALHARFIADVKLVDGVETPIQHGLGQAPVMVTISPPRGPSSTGRIEEVLTGRVSRDRTIVLKATGWGATITIDVEVK